MHDVYVGIDWATTEHAVCVLEGAGRPIRRSMIEHTEAGSTGAYAHPDVVAGLAGMTPVTRQSGRHEVVLFRWACNKWLRQAFATFADNSRHANP